MWLNFYYRYRPFNINHSQTIHQWHMEKQLVLLMCFKSAEGTKARLLSTWNVHENFSLRRILSQYCCISPQLGSTEFLNVDSLIEEALHRCVIKPLKQHLYQLFVKDYKCNGQLQQLSENIRYARTKTPYEMGIRVSDTTRCFVLPWSLLSHNP